jgi:hypothetical protein
VFKDYEVQQEDLIDTTSELNIELGKETAELNSLFEAAKNDKISRDARLKAINKLNQEYGEYLPSLLSEKTSIEDIAVAQEKANEALRNAIALRLKQQTINQLEARFNQIFKEELENIVKNTKDLNDAQKSVFTADFFRRTFEAKEVAKEYYVNQQRLEVIEKRINYLRANSTGLTKAHKNELKKLTSVHSNLSKEQAGLGKELNQFHDSLMDIGNPAIRKSFLKVSAAQFDLFNGIQKTDDAFSKFMSTITGDGDEDKSVSGRLNFIEEAIKSLNTRLKELSADDIEKGLADPINKSIKALQLEAQLIKTLGDETKNLAKIRDSRHENQIRKLKMINDGYEVQRQIIDLNKDAELNSLRDKVSGYNEEIESLDLIIKSNKDLGTTTVEEAKKRKANLLEIITLLKETGKLSEKEADQAKTRVTLEELRSKDATALAGKEKALRKDLFDDFVSLGFKRRDFEKQLMEQRDKDLEADKMRIQEAVKAGNLTQKEAAESITNIESEQSKIRLKILEDEQKKREEFINRSVDALKQSLDTASTLNEVAANNQTARVKQSRDQQLRIIEQQLDQGLISEQEYQLRRTFFEEQAAKKIAKIKAEQARKDKQLAKIQAIIDGAVAIQKTTRDLGYPLAIPFVAAVAAQTAAQVALIDSQPLPEFEKGGLIDGGLLKGKRHSQGGIVLEAEGGEFINSRKSTSAYMPYLEAANEMRLPEFIMSNDVKPMLELQLAGLKGSLSSSEFYDGNIVRALKGEKKLMQRQVELLERMSSNQHRNLRA